MLKQPQPFIKIHALNSYIEKYKTIQTLLYNLLDSPVIKTYHIGGTAQTNYTTEPIIDVLVVVNSLHDITSMDEKRLNYHNFYRLHHKYDKKVMMAQFKDLKSLTQIARLHIVENNKQLYKDYLLMDQLMKSDKQIIQQFQEYKLKAFIDAKTIQEYEQIKQVWFKNIKNKL